MSEPAISVSVPIDSVERVANDVVDRSSPPSTSATATAASTSLTLVAATEASSDVKRPLRVAVYLADQNPHRDRSRGITEMTQSLFAFLRTCAELHVTQVVSRSSYRYEDESERLKRIPWRTDHKIGRLLADSVHPFVMPSNADLWYYPKGYVSPLIRRPVPMIGTMHDTIVQHYADNYPHTRKRSELSYWVGMTKRSLNTFDSVLTVSENAKLQLLGLCDRYQIKPPTIEVTYESSNWENYCSWTFTKEDYVVHLANSAPHKRTNWLLQQWQKLQTSGRMLPKLVLIGQLDHEGNELLARCRHVELRAPMRRLQLVQTIGEARALILPSEIEGFGLPALEAYYVSTPVCWVENTSVEEVVGPDGIFGRFDLNDQESLYQALNQTLAIDASVVEQMKQQLLGRFNSQLVSRRIVNHFLQVSRKA